MSFKANCYVIVRSDECPAFGGDYETPEDVYEHFNYYDTFTQRVYSSLRAANRDMKKLNEEVEDGCACYSVYGCYCKLYEKGAYNRA